MYKNGNKTNFRLKPRNIYISKEKRGIQAWEHDTIS